MARLRREPGKSTISVTHDRNQTMALADPSMVLRAERVEPIGSPSDIHGDPDVVSVAGFVGSPRILWNCADLRLFDAAGLRIR